MHKDIKPDNFLFGLGPQKSSQIYLIDHGLTSRYCSKTDGEHIPFKTNKSVIGTMRYMSNNAHLGFE